MVDMIEKWVIQWFDEHSATTIESMSRNENYIELEYIDSFGFISLIGDCEEEFDIHFEDEDFDNQSLLSIDGLINTIEIRLERK